MGDVPAQAVLNDAAVRRFDPYVNVIIDTAKYVALYKFNKEGSEWEKTYIEGPLFVYSRIAFPFFSVLVLNRLNKNNLVEPIVKELELQLQEPFLLYRKNSDYIYGIWFYKTDECTRLAGLIKNLMECDNHQFTKMSDKKRVKRGPNVDLFEMLTKAQEAYNNKSIQENKRSPQQTEETPQSVIEFFAKAAPQPNNGPVILGSNPPPIAVDAYKNSRKPLLQELMSTPFCRVEHIEKQQRSVTPQTEGVPRPLSGHIEHESQHSTKEDSGRLPRFENGLQGFNFLRISSPSQAEPINQLRPLSAPHGSAADLDKPALMPPAMFAPSVMQEKPEVELATCSDLEIEPEPLTKNQLLQAMSYLLKHDSEFMTKIHEAYVKSLTDMVL